MPISGGSHGVNLFAAATSSIETVLALSGLDLDALLRSLSWWPSSFGRSSLQSPGHLEREICDDGDRENGPIGL